MQKDNLWREKQNEASPRELKADALGPGRAGNEPSTAELSSQHAVRHSQSHVAQRHMPAPLTHWERAHLFLGASVCTAVLICPYCQLDKTWSHLEREGPSWRIPFTRLAGGHVCEGNSFDS